MKTTWLQRILAVMLSTLLPLTVAPTAVFAADAIEYVDAMTDGTGTVIEKTYAGMMERNVDVGNNIDQYADLRTAQDFAGVLKRK